MKKTIALILATSALFIAGCSTTHQTTKWEYQTVHTIKGVNERAAQGWSVANVVVKPDGSHEYLLKRPIQ
jgi:PBP1b-binding outer membrane lipoprotein LpoB